MGKILIGKDDSSLKESSFKKENQFETLFNKIKDIETLLFSSEKTDYSYDVDFKSLLKSQDLNSLQENLNNIDKKTNVLEKTDFKIKSILESLELFALNNNELKELIKQTLQHVNELELNYINLNNAAKQEYINYFKFLEINLVKTLNEISIINSKIDEQNKNNKNNFLLDSLEKIKEENNNNNTQLAILLNHLIVEFKNFKTNQGRKEEEENVRQKRLKFILKICITLNIVSVLFAYFL